MERNTKREYIFRSIGLGLDDIGSHRCSPKGSTKLEAPQLPLVKFAQLWLGHAPLAHLPVWQLSIRPTMTSNPCAWMTC